jgi:DNA topoisomerase-1
LAVPPAWRDVWICADERGHLQATGRDARGRKVYRYHPDYRETRDATKFDQLIEFGRVLPAIRRRVARDLRRHAVPRDKVLAAAVRMLELTLLRVGNEEYARANASFGLTTLRARHARVDGSAVRFRFRGKSGKWHSVTVRDRRLARMVARWQDLPGQELFQYTDTDGELESIDSADVNQYLRDAAGIDITSKQFRTWAATVLAMRALKARRAQDDRTSNDGAAPPGRVRREVVEVMEAVAERLGNTPAVARGSYVHPAVVDAFAAGELPAGARKATMDASTTRSEELELLRLLRAARTRERRAARATTAARTPAATRAETPAHKKTPRH